MISGWLAHAFSLAPVEAEIPLVQCEAAEAVCRLIVARRMAPVALAFLELSRPLNYVGAQAMHFFSPFAPLLGSMERYAAFTKFLERRDSIEWMCQKIEELDRSPVTEVVNIETGTH